MTDGRIIRHRGKIEATVANAAATLALHEEGDTLGEVLWSFAPLSRVCREQVMTSWR